MELEEALQQDVDVILYKGVIMDKKLLKLPILTLIGGIILRIVNYITAFTLIKGTSEWTLEMGTTAFYIGLVTSIILFVVIGIILRRIYDRKTFLKSATLLVIYSIVILGLEQITQYFWTYSMIIYWLYLPSEIFTTITSVLARVSTAESINWTYAIPSLFAPYLFVLFGTKSESGS
jgi:heme exporter protein D